MKNPVLMDSLSLFLPMNVVARVLKNERHLFPSQQNFNDLIAYSGSHCHFSSENSPYDIVSSFMSSVCTVSA